MGVPNVVVGDPLASLPDLTERLFHACVRLKVGITDGFVRVSCGIEDTEDLIAALKKGLDDL